MKTKIVIEDKKKGKVEIPITNRELHDMYDIMHMIYPKSWETIKLNKCDKSFTSFHKKLEHAVFDVLGEGKWGNIKKTKSGKKKFVTNKKRHYLVKKPKWLKKK